MATLAGHEGRGAALMLPALGVLATAFLPPVVWAQAMVVGWIETAGANSGISTGPSIASKVAITRKGNKVDYDEQSGLQACDKLKLADPSAAFRITLTNKEHLRLDAQRPELELPCDRAGVTVQVAAFLRGVLGAAEARRPGAVVTASRSLSNAKSASVPALIGERSQIAAGERALFLAWKGGRAPFSIRISRHGEAAVLATANGIAGHSTRLPGARYTTGRHVLIITDSAGKTMRNEALHVVPGSMVPRIPRDLGDAALPENTRLLYYADYLLGFEDGRFAFEALQQAAAVSPQTPAAREWLREWGDAD